MSMPITSATSGSSMRRCTSSAPHHLATPVTRTRLFFATRVSLGKVQGPMFPASAHTRGLLARQYDASGCTRVFRALVRPLDHVALHVRDCLDDDVAQRVF